MDRRYNIAIIAGQLVVGGAERQLYLWLSHLDRKKFRPVVMTLHPNCGDYWENAIEALGIPLLQIQRRRSRLIRLLDIVRALRPYKPQLIHGWHLFASPYAGVAAKLLGAKSIGGVRGTFRAFCDSSLEANLTLWLVDAILVNSTFTADQLRWARKRKKQIIHTVQNAVEEPTIERVEMREELAQRFGFSSEYVWIGSLGRLDPGKRFDLILKVLAHLREAGFNFRFLLIGDGPERSHLESLADELGIGQYVVFAGEVPGASAWLGALDIFCFTSLDEGLPNAVMEAAVAGVPIVSWRVPFIKELLENDEAAMLVEPEDLVGFRDALIDLIRSPNLRTKLGRAAHDHVLERFTVDRFVQRMTRIYEDLPGIQSGPQGER